MMINGAKGEVLHNIKQQKITFDHFSKHREKNSK